VDKKDSAVVESSGVTDLIKEGRLLSE